MRVERKKRPHEVGVLVYKPGFMSVVVSSPDSVVYYPYKTIAELNKDWKTSDAPWPQVGECYYAIKNNGDVEKYIWEANQEKKGLPVFNVFETRESAKRFLEQCSDFFIEISDSTREEC